MFIHCSVAVTNNNVSATKRTNTSYAFFFFYGVFENSVSVSYLPKGLLEKSWLFPLIRLGEVFKIKLNIYLESKKVLSGMFSFLINLIY